jgi:hypothetical protein
MEADYFSFNYLVMSVKFLIYFGFVLYMFFLVMSWGNSVSIVPGYRVNDRYSIP